MNYDNEIIQRRVAELSNKVLSIWALEGKWEKDNPNAPLYGMERDPLVNLLLTALAYQELQIEADINRFRSGMVDELEEAMLPYHLTKAVPAIVMMSTAKAKGNPERCVVGDGTSFTLRKESFRERTTINFCPLFESNIIGATVTGLEQLPDGRWKLTLAMEDEKADLGGVGFFFKDMAFDNLVMRMGDKEINLIKPWEYDRFPMSPDFSFWSMAYNKSLLFGTNEQWFDLWAEQPMQYYMVEPYDAVVLPQGTVELILDFVGLRTTNIGTGNVCINSFPVVNVNKRSFALTPSEPIVKIADDKDYFLNLVGQPDIIGEADKFILRRYGCERFGFSELLRLADTLQKRNSTDFYAYQEISALKDGEKMRKLKVLLKDILNDIRGEVMPKSGVYALLKGDAQIEVSIPLKALYTDGSRANGVESGSVVLEAPSDFDLGQTCVLTTSMGGRDEVVNTDERRMLSHYYALTNDKLVTRSDLKSFCVKELRRYNIGVNRIEVLNTAEGTRNVVAYVSGVNPELDLSAIAQRIQRLIDVHSSGLMSVTVTIQNS